jgi:plasmid maintenance system killer protein
VLDQNFKNKMEITIKVNNQYHISYIFTWENT